MEILSHKDHRQLLTYLPYVKMTLNEWLFVDIGLTEPLSENLTAEEAAEAVHGIFKSREGKLFVINEREILMIVRWEKTNPISTVADNISVALPKDGCEIYVHEPTIAGLAKLEVLITYKKPASAPTLADRRALRRKNVVEVADDDMYMRMLVKKGLGPRCEVVEIADGMQILDTYQAKAPDILFLDIHMPNMNGTNVLQQILAIDPKAFVVMLSADSSRDNVEYAAHNGAKGFLTKPFTKEKLEEYLTKCPTIS